MMYKAPFYAVQKAVYAALQKSDIGLEWFDAAVPIEEIAELHKKQAEFAYGIIGAQTADCTNNKDLTTWDANIRLNIYSNYKGKREIAVSLEKLLNYFNGDGWDELQKSFKADGYVMIAMTVGALAINTPMYSDIGIWQSGGTQVTFRLNQIEEV